MHVRTRIRSLFTLALAACVILVIGIPTLAQSTAVLQGRVIDPQGAVLPNATVVVRNEATSVERTTQTDDEGNYQLAALPVGNYRVDVKAHGFHTTTISNLVIEVARTLVQNFQLEIGDISQQVLITSDAPVIESATTSVGTVINQRTVQEIPLNGRHFVDLGLLIPGRLRRRRMGF